MRVASTCICMHTSAYTMQDKEFSHRMAGRTEIDEKQVLRAKFQHAVNETNTMVASWLGDSSKSDKHENFFQLPVMNPGSGLSLGDKQEKGTIGDFVHGYNVKKASHRQGVNKPESAALGALKNKMRNTKRAKVERPVEQNNSNSDSDEEVKSFAKKGSNLFLDNMKKKKRR